MSEQTLTDPGPGLVLGESRGRVLDVLRAAGRPMGVREVAERVGLHQNTARFHLDGLVDAGLAERRAEERSEPGRPRMVYAGTAMDVPSGQRSYRLLAEMLTGLVADTVTEPERAAEAAGEAWGRYLAERPAPSQRVDAEEGMRRLLSVLADMGFAPDPARAAGEARTDPHPAESNTAMSDAVAPPAREAETLIPLRHCPFREVAEQHQEVVCSLHLGLMRGVLAEVRAPLRADRLEPFVEPSLCLAHLAPPADEAR